MGRGRHSKLTPEVQDRLIKALTAGATIKDSCDYAGIGVSTFHQWIKVGESGRHNQFTEFGEAVKKARSAGRIESIALIRQAAKSNWQAAAWFLERSDPENWARRTKVEIDLPQETLEKLKQLEKLAAQHGHDVGEIFNAIISQYADADSE